jgi:hypothetical protein
LNETGRDNDGVARSTIGEGKLVAHGTSSVIVLPGFGFPGGPKLPPKFL